MNALRGETIQGSKTGETASMEVCKVERDRTVAPVPEVAELPFDLS